MNDIEWGKVKTKRENIQSHVRRFLLFPDFWKDNSKHLTILLDWKEIKFNDSNFNLIPTSKGIYCFVVIPNTPNLFTTRYLFYIGKASSATLRSRYKNYIDEMKGLGIGKQKPRIKVREMLNDYYDHIYFFYSELEDKNLIIDCEEKLINTYYPYVNSLIPEATINEEFKHIY